MKLSSSFALFSTAMMAMAVAVVEGSGSAATIPTASESSKQLLRGKSKLNEGTMVRDVI